MSPLHFQRIFLGGAAILRRIVILDMFLLQASLYDAAVDAAPLSLLVCTLMCLGHHSSLQLTIYCGQRKTSGI